MERDGNEIWVRTAALFCSAAFATLVLSGCGETRWLREFEVDDAGFDSEVMREITEGLGHSLPPGTKGLHFRYSPPIDPSFIAKLEVPHQARQIVFKQIETLKDEDISISGTLIEKVSWWIPATETVLIDRECTKTDGAYFRAVLTTRAGQVFLYLSHAVF